MALTTNVRIFCSYAHADGDLREELFRHLALLRQAGIIQAWYDGEITPGKQWANEIEEALRSADVVLLLVSADLLTSEYVQKLELPVALDRHRAHDALVIPVLLRPVAWSYSGLDFLQALPAGLRPVVLWQPRDLAYVDVCEGLVKAILAWQKGATAPTPAPLPAAVTRRRVMDVGLPTRVPIGLSTVLVILVRRPDSKGLAGLLQIETAYGIEPEEVQSSASFPVRFPCAPDGSSQPVDFTVTIETSDFALATPAKPLTVPARGDSDPCIFLLTALKAGRLVVNVELAQGERRVAGCVLVSLGVPGAVYQPEVRASVNLEMAEYESSVITRPACLAMAAPCVAEPAAEAAGAGEFSRMFGAAATASAEAAAEPQPAAATSTFTAPPAPPPTPFVGSKPHPEILYSPRSTMPLMGVVLGLVLVGVVIAVIIGILR